MLINLVKKDLILAKKYLLFMLLFAAIGPLFLSYRMQLHDSGSISFLVTVLFMEFILFNSVSVFEEKYKGASLLCATPYTRNALVQAKYLLIFTIFLADFVIYTVTSLVVPQVLSRLSPLGVGTALLFISLYFGVFIPMQYKYGYEKTKFVSMMVVFVTPFIVPVVMKWYQSRPASLLFTLPLPQEIQQWIPCILAFVIGIVSMKISMRIYAGKNL
ncbi:ABC-2 transporter permease [Paenibacillus alvei]|uniref:ABC-2 transporter permease n=1 Tax=Paenibacillus alvei TaxID=44250 RepID=UPI0018CE0E12|nr:ABC-2 transporter permease [Paenibacillus alvei]MBG9733638.1 ABC transporter permease [Paenibacillus alvei]MBG9744046.1 ABC transporter permease [Paenibacillus alvei]MCY9582951.1 ABC-2 transporter permease [Paenibacillus alvei]MCY9588214.1 ABC-2 transporter permease [Paenibacillus alvei]